MTRETEERFVDNGDIQLRVETTGSGPTVLCIPGWPELATSWHHQVAHLADRGFTVAALDVRGYGGSASPPQVERYTLRELAGDVAAVAAALSDEPVVLVGHDWGAPIAYTTAIRHRDQVRAVAGLSVPYTPAGGFSLVDVFDAVHAEKFFYFLHFQEPGVAEAEFEVDLRAGLKKAYYAASGHAPHNSFLPEGPRGAAFLPLLPEPPDGPLPFVSDADLDAAAAAFGRTGMVGAFNRYRAAPIDGTETDVVGASVEVPSCFIGGEVDPVRSFFPDTDLYADPGAGCTDYRGTTLVAGAGHWVQQESPTEVNAALDTFLGGLWP